MEPYFKLRFASCEEKNRLFELKWRRNRNFWKSFTGSSSSSSSSSSQEPIRRRKRSKLSEEMRKMVNNPTCSDITFICQDGVRVHASRMLLVAKFSVFHTMLRNGMAESRQSEISLPAITSTSLIAILEFFYTGELAEEDLQWRLREDDADSHPSRAWIGLVQIIEGAHYFMLEELEDDLLEMFWNKILPDVPWDDGTLEKFACRLTLVLKIFDNIIVNDIDSHTPVSEVEFVTLILVRMLYSHDLTSAVLRQLSPRAFFYFFSCTQRVKGMKIDHSEAEGNSDQELCGDTVQEDLPGGFSLNEYIRFRQLITWCCFQEAEGGDPEVGGVLNENLKFLPQPLEAKAYLDNPTALSLGTPSTLESWRNLLHDIMKTHLLDFSMIDLTLIHPELLLNIVEPLNIIPTSEVLDVLRAHVLRGSLRLHKTHNYGDLATVRPSGRWRVPCTKLDNCPFTESGDRLSVEADGPAVLACWSGAIWFYDDCEWEIGFHSSQKLEDWEVGFVHLFYGENILSMDSFVSSASGWGVLLQGDLLYVSDNSTILPYYHCCGRANDRVLIGLGKRKKKAGGEIRVNLVIKRREKTCSFLYEGKKLFCQRLPDSTGTMYPAVYLPKTPFPVSITIKVVKGFAYYVT